MRKIICAGCHRSGSTWLFNALRLSLREAQIPFYSCFHNEYDSTRREEYHVIKTHNFLKQHKHAYRIFTTTRDLRDIAASAVRRKLIENTPEEVVKYVKRVVNREHTPWKKYSHLEIRYEKMYFNKVRTLTSILRKLDLIVDPKKVHKKVEGLIIPKKQMSQITQLHPNHITKGTNGRPSSYKNVLSEESINLIEDEFGWWLEKHNYI